MMNRNMIDLLWIIVFSLAFCFSIYILSNNVKESNRQYYDTVNKCIEHGGLWNRQNYQCVRTK
jgi:hypothetical protein